MKLFKPLLALTMILFVALAAVSAHATAVDFSLTLEDAECAPLGSCSVPIYCNASDGNVRFVKATIEYNANYFQFDGFTSNISGGFFDTNDDLPFGVCGSGVTENAVAMWSGVDGLGGLIGWANFTALSGAQSAPVRLDCYVGNGVAHLEMWSYDKEGDPIDAAFNRTGQSYNGGDFVVLDAAINVTGEKPVAIAVNRSEWGAIKRLYR